MIDTILGLKEESELVCEAVPFDGPRYYAIERRYRVPGQDQVIARYHSIQWEKKNDFLDTPAVVTTSRGDVSSDLLVKSTGVDEDDSEYTCWVEYRFIGEDEIVQRSAHVRSKLRKEQATTTPGNFC